MARCEASRVINAINDCVLEKRDCHVISYAVILSYRLCSRCALVVKRNEVSQASGAEER